jgi:small-conductance mechanosensitive channel
MKDMNFKKGAFVTFKTKYKIGDRVIIRGKPRMIEGVRLEVSAVSKLIFYRYSNYDGTVILDISENDLLLENLPEKK